MKQFLDKDFLLSTDMAKTIYHDYAENMLVGMGADMPALIGAPSKEKLIEAMAEAFGAGGVDEVRDEAFFSEPYLAKGVALHLP